MLAHRQALFAGIAVAVVATYMLGPMIAAPAAQAQRTIERNITVHCLPYCNVAHRPTDISRDVDDIVHIRIHFSFLPR
ncbi:MAG: hypothetical protein M3247_06335 [Thermoproteota archaeon]|nr:hypothetical protein [Thermoproteota archaeon]